MTTKTKDQKETPGQEEMDETGAELDTSQNNQLEGFMNFVEEGPVPENSTEEEEEEKEDKTPKAGDETEEEEGDDTSEEEGSGDEDEEEGDEEEDDDGEGEEDEGEEEEGDESSLREQVAEMRKTIDALMLGGASEKEEEDIIIEDEVALPEVKVPKDLVSEKLAEALGLPLEALTELASGIYTRAREDALRDTPELIAGASRRQTQMASAQSKFWKEFPKLAKAIESNPTVLNFIQVTANKVASENPTWGVLKAYREAGRRVSKVVSLTEQASEIEESLVKGKGKGKKKRTVKQAPKPRGRRRAPGGGKENRSGTQQQIDELLESVG